MFRRLTLAIAVVLALVGIAQAQPSGQCTDWVQTSATNVGNVAFNATIPAKAGNFFYPSVLIGQMVANAAVTGAAGPAGVVNTAGLATNVTFFTDNSSLTIGQLNNFLNTVIPLGTLRTATNNTAFQLQWTGASQASQTVRLVIIGCYGP